MADYEENIKSGVACSGQKGLYVGSIYHMVGRPARHELRRTPPVHFGTYKGYLEDPVLATHNALNLVDQEYGIEIDAERLVALSILRICARVRHVAAELPKGAGHRLERVASLAVARSVIDVEALKPLTSYERRISPQGIGHARRVTPGMAAIGPLVHLPVTRAEQREWPVTAAIRAAGFSSSLASDPYVALHTQDDRSIEQVILLDDLQ